MSEPQPMQPYQPRYVADPQLRAEARKSIRAKRELQVHLTSYAIVISALVVIWLVTSAPGYFWPIWPMMGWGIGIAFHVASLRWDRPVTEAEITAEAERMRRLGGGPEDTV